MHPTPFQKRMYEFDNLRESQYGQIQQVVLKKSDQI